MKKKKQIFHRFGSRSIKNLITKIDNSFRNPPKKDAGCKIQKKIYACAKKRIFVSEECDITCWIV